jgi:hypothetical protein
LTGTKAVTQIETRKGAETRTGTGTRTRIATADEAILSLSFDASGSMKRLFVFNALYFSNKVELSLHMTSFKAII